MDRAAFAARSDRHLSEGAAAPRQLELLFGMKVGAQTLCLSEAASRLLLRNHKDESMMIDDWNAFLDSLSPGLKALRGGQAEVMAGFSAIAKAALKPGALDAKNKELIALGISVAMRCDDCIGFHVKAAVEKGASREEILETMGMAIYMGAGPSVMYAAHAVSAFDQLSEGRATSAALR